MDAAAQLRAIVGDAGVLDAAALALVRPRNTAEVSAVLRWCHAQRIAVVPQGGLTGLVRGADASPSEVILSLERMNAIEAIDPVQRIALAQAGVVLQALHEAVEAQDLSFPLDLGARGSATVGGTAATNAGGNRVIRYGMMRELVLGLEVVLADGTIVSSLNRLLKNNAGYDLKQLFIGSEGTLGVITRLVLRLRERPRSHDVALVAVPSFEAVRGLLARMQVALGGALSAFEVMWPAFYRLVTTPPANGQPPLPHDHAFYVLVESLGADPLADAERFGAALESAHADGLVANAAIAKSAAERRSIWALRDDVGQMRVGGAIAAFDVSLPIASMQGYVDGVRSSLDTTIGEHRLFVFGHLGDGNLHLIVQLEAARCEALKPAIEQQVYQPLAAIGGSISAEHGIGLTKKRWLPISRSNAEIALMRTLKVALDPRGILNPGKVV